MFQPSGTDYFFYCVCFFQQTGNQGTPETQAHPKTLINSNTEGVLDHDFNEISQPIGRAEHPVSTPRGDMTTLLQSTRARTTGQKRRFEAITDAVRELKDLNEKLGTSTSSTVCKEDECDIMGKHIAFQLRELPIHDRVRANFEIQKILTDFRLKNIVQPPSTISSGMTNSSTSSILDISSNPCTPHTCTSEQSTDNDVFNTGIIQAAMSSSDIQYF